MPNDIFVRSTSTDIKLSKAQIFKIIQSSGYFGSWSANLWKKSLRTVAIPLAKENISRLVSNFTSNAIKKNKGK